MLNKMLIRQRSHQKAALGQRQNGSACWTLHLPVVLARTDRVITHELWESRSGWTGPADTFGSYGARWANVSNTPFRMFKMWTHEGGIATPLIAYWPAVIRARGTITREVGHFVDIMATCLDLAGTEYPAAAKGGSPSAPLDGRSLLPVLLGSSREPAPLFWEHEGNRAVRQGPWKLVSAYPGDWQTLRDYPKEGRWELYDLAKDRTELHDLAALHPDKVRELSAHYESWASGAGVVPWAELSASRK